MPNDTMDRLEGAVAGQLQCLVRRQQRMRYCSAMSRFLISLFLTIAITGCKTPITGYKTAWTPPNDPVLRGSDTRACDSQTKCVDLVWVIDTSLSMGVDPENGSITDKDDARTVLWLLIESLRYALTELDHRAVGVAIAAFAGEVGASRSAWIEAELTNEYTVAAEALERLKLRNPLGRSCVSCGIEVGLSVLAASKGARERCASMTVITDGSPTMPYGPLNLKRNLEAVSKAAASSPEETRITLMVLNETVFPGIVKGLGRSNVSVELAESPSSLADLLVTAARNCK